MSDLNLNRLITVLMCRCLIDINDKKYINFEIGEDTWCKIPLGTIPEIHDENVKIVINNHLGYLISKSNKCSTCMLKHNDNTCFFASACFPNYDYYTEKEEKSER